METDLATIDEEQVAGLLGRFVNDLKTGGGVAWGDHDPDILTGCERYRPGYGASLLSSWIPALDGVQAKLEAGTQVADVGCGHGASTLIMAQAHSNSVFVGFDYHQPSIRHAQKVAANAGLAERCRFEVATVTSYPGVGYDLVTVFDALHDMGDPVGAAVHIRQSLTPAGTLLLVEPYASERRLREVVTAAGFGHISRVAQTPFNLVYEARP